jgi:hypothetical protein
VTFSTLLLIGRTFFDLDQHDRDELRKKAVAASNNDDQL